MVSSVQSGNGSVHVLTAGNVIVVGNGTAFTITGTAGSVTSIIGTAGSTDTITFGTNGGTIFGGAGTPTLLEYIDVLYGSTAGSGEWVQLGTSGSGTTITLVGAVDSLTGSATINDHVILGTAQTALSLAGLVETLTGGSSGTSIINLFGAQTLVVAQGSTVSSPTLHLVGDTASQSLTLASSASRIMVSGTIETLSGATGTAESVRSGRPERRSAS